MAFDFTFENSSKFIKTLFRSDSFLEWPNGLSKGNICKNDIFLSFFSRVLRLSWPKFSSETLTDRLTFWF